MKQPILLCLILCCRKLDIVNNIIESDMRSLLFLKHQPDDIKFQTIFLKTRALVLVADFGGDIEQRGVRFQRSSENKFIYKLINFENTDYMLLHFIWKLVIVTTVKPLNFNQT